MKDIITITNKVIISDPCYERGNKYSKQIDTMLAGEYECFIQYEEDEEESSYPRVKCIGIIHIDCKEQLNWELCTSEIGVDSGIAGIFCESIYPLDKTGDYFDNFNNKCTDLTNQNMNEYSEYHRFIRDLEFTDKFIKSLEEDLDRLNPLLWMRDYNKRQIGAFISLEAYIQENKSLLENWYNSEEDKEEEFLEFCDKIYQSESKWTLNTYLYSYNLYNTYLEQNIILEEPVPIVYGIIDDKGIVSKSGYGDGAYECYTIHDKDNNCIGIKLRFI